MKILGREKIYDCIRKHASSKKPLEAWVDEAERAAWQTPQDIKDRYRSVDFVADNGPFSTSKVMITDSSLKFAIRTAL